jgi:hypothetical protein
VQDADGHLLVGHGERTGTGLGEGTPGQGAQQRRGGKAEEKSAAEMEVGVVSVARAHVFSKSFERHPADRLE